MTADSEAISVENSEYQRDPELQRALRAIKSELYEKTPAYYRHVFLCDKLLSGSYSFISIKITEL